MEEDSKIKKIEDEDFEKEFTKWLNSKTEKEIVESLKKYSIDNEECSNKYLKER